MQACSFGAKRRKTHSETGDKMKHVPWIALLSLGTLWGQTRQVAIIDPVLQMKAFSFTIPATWIFQGAVTQGSSCSAGASPVVRAMSPDGITEVKALPEFDWTWSDAAPGMAKSKPNADCLPFEKEMPASDFLKYMVGVLGVTFVQEQPAPWLPEMQENIRRVNANSASMTQPGTPAFSQKADAARFIVRYNVNSIPIEEFLDATILCRDAPMMIGTKVAHFHTCNAFVSRSRARQGQLQAMAETFKAIGKSRVVDPQWNQRWMAMQTQRIQASGAAFREKQKETSDQIMQARQVAYEQGQEMRKRQHEEFLATMQRGTDMAMRRAQETSNAKSRTANDWADYALDQQKRRDPNTGEITKDSSRYSYTWVDQSGQRVQTNDVNDNPNGRLNGTWTLQQNVQ
jgi:hypothetical protein